MKTTKLLQIRTLVAVALTASLSLASLSKAATIVGSKHDLRTFMANSETQVCVTCHTPHNAKGNTLTPLWNHATTAVAAFTLYSSTSLNAALGQPSSNSTKACLSCHDGTVAVDSYGTTTTGTKFATGSALLGSDLSNDHPVSFTYDAALATADGGLVTPASASLVDTVLPLFSGKLECATCHNPHDSTNGKFLRKSNVASALCVTCHNK